MVDCYGYMVYTIHTWIRHGQIQFQGSVPETVVQPTSPNSGAAQGGELHAGLLQVEVPPVPPPLGGGDGPPPLGGGDGPAPLGGGVPQPAGGGAIPGPQVTPSPEQSWQNT